MVPNYPRDAANVLNNWVYADLISVQMMGLVHPEFTSVAQRNEKFWTNEFDSLQQADYSREDGMIGYGHAGFDHAAEIYARVRKEHPEFNVAADDIDAWGYELLSNGHVREATEIMKLEVQLKASSQAYIGLAEAYRVSGQQRLAVKAYRHALALEPTNTYVKGIITALDEPGTSRE